MKATFPTGYQRSLCILLYRLFIDCTITLYTIIRYTKERKIVKKEKMELICAAAFCLVMVRVGKNFAGSCPAFVTLLRYSPTYHRRLVNMNVAMPPMVMINSLPFSMRLSSSILRMMEKQSAFFLRLFFEINTC